MRSSCFSFIFEVGILSLSFLNFYPRQAHKRAKQLSFPQPFPLNYGFGLGYGELEALNHREKKLDPSAVVALYWVADPAYRRLRSLSRTQLASFLRFLHSVTHS
jgi:hypothetical protein